MSKGLKRSEFLFFMAYILWLVFAVIKLTYLKELIPFKEINDYVEKITIVILLLKFLDDDKYKYRDIAGVIVVAILYYVSLQAEAPGIMLPIYFVYSARNIDYRDIFKVTILIQLSVMIISVASSLGGIIPNEIWDEETRARYSLGYTFCTYGSHISFFMTLLYMSLRTKINGLETLGLLAWNFVWYEVTNTRIDLFLCVPAIMGCYVLSKTGFKIKDNWCYRIALAMAGPVLAGVAIAGQWGFDDANEKWLKIDTLLNGRLMYGHEALQKFDISLMGQYIKWIGRGSVKKHPDWVYNYVDCSYLKYLLHYGFFFFCVLMVAIVVMGALLPKQKNLGLVITYIAWLVYGMIDAELFELNFQPVMLLLGSGCFERLTTIKKKKQETDKNKEIKIRLNKWRL